MWKDAMGKEGTGSFSVDRGIKEKKQTSKQRSELARWKETFGITFNSERKNKDTPVQRSQKRY